MKISMITSLLSPSTNNDTLSSPFAKGNMISAFPSINSNRSKPHFGVQDRLTLVREDGDKYTRLIEIEKRTVEKLNDRINKMSNNIEKHKLSKKKGESKASVRDKRLDRLRLNIQKVIDEGNDLHLNFKRVSRLPIINASFYFFN
jgi:hypothetical protein